MLWRAITLCLFVIIFASSLLAEDDPDDENIPILCKNVSPQGSQEVLCPLASLECEPSVLVHGCINVITGQFCDTSTDLVVHHGTDPLCVERTFFGGTIKDGTLGVSWYTSHSSHLKLKRKSSKKIVQGYLQEDHGGTILFEKKVESKREKIDRLPVEASVFHRGVTNTSQGYLSGQTNLKNYTLSITNKFCFLYTGSYKYKRYNLPIDEKHHAYYLSVERRNSGNYFSYQLEDEEQLVKASIKNAKERLAGTLNYPVVNKKKFKKEMQVEITTNDGRWVRYSFIKARNKSYIMTRAERSDAPTEVYAYESITQGKLPGIRYITDKSLPNGRSLTAQHYEDGTYYLLGQKVKLEDFDPRCYRVHSLLAPAGVDDQKVPIYQFLYHLDTDKGTFDGMTYGFKQGGCEVYDALHYKTYYGFNADHRLAGIHKYSANGDLYSTEHLCWGANDSSEVTCLKARSFQAENAAVFARTYKYDSAGNVLEDALYGNLSGHPSIPLQLNADGSPLDNGCECYRKFQTYSENGYNLLLKETEGAQTTSYEYAPGTANIVAKFLGTDTQILRRWFYRYNDDAALIQEIVDDGNTHDPNDLSGATERHITQYTQSETYPVGFPLVIEKKCLDLNTGQELLVHKVVNTYTNTAHISTQEHYDSNGCHCYTLSWKYDNMGNITEEVDAHGRATRWRYDENGNCVREQGSHFEWHKEYVYDYMNRLICEKEIHRDGINREVSHRYDLVGNRIATVDAYGNETLFYYDAFHRLIRTEYPTIQDEKNTAVRPISKKKYDAMSHVTVEIDGLGIEKRMRYTIRGQLVDVMYPDGTTEKNTYHLNGMLKETKARNGTLTRFTHDALGRPIHTEIFSASGELLSKTSIVYRGFHIEKEIDPMGVETFYTYYPDGKMKSKQRGGSLIEYVYDPMGRSTETRETHEGADVIVKRLKYDLLNRVIEESTEDAQGTILLKKGYVFDCFGNLHIIKNYHEAGSSAITTTYNSHGVPIYSRDGNNVSTMTRERYDYINSLGQYVPCKEVSDSLGNVTVTIYDALGRVVTMLKKNALGAVTQKQTQAYDVAGNLRTITDTIITPGEEDREISSHLEYDTSGRLVRCCEAVGTPDQKQTRMSYNHHGQKCCLIKNDGTTLMHAYDALGRLKSLTSSDKTIDYIYTYDLNGNPLKVEDRVHHIVTEKVLDASGRLIKEVLGNDLSVDYQYDGSGRTTQVNLPDRTGIAYTYRAIHLDTVTRLDKMGEAVYAHRYDSYDLSGLLLKETLPGAHEERTYQYDKVGRIKVISCALWKEELTRIDGVGNVLQKKLSDSHGTTVTNFRYDNLYQLISEKGRRTQEHEYVYDSHYNRHSKDGKIHQLNRLNQLLDDGKHQYEYDLNGNLCRKKNQERENIYTYDALDRLITFCSGEQKVDYLYDENNRRLSKAHYSKNSAGAWQCLETERYLYQGQNEIGSVNEEGKVVELRVLGLGKGAEIGAAVAMEIYGKLYIPIHDRIGNVACLLDGTTGEACECYRYSTFGEMVLEGAISPWRFSSKRVDEETGFIYFGRRYYDPETGRWVTPDPIGREGGLNLYAYVLNRPLTHIDHYGLFGLESGWQSFVGSLCESLGRLIGHVLSFPGQVVNFIGYHLMPIPYVKDVVEFGGWCLAGKNPSEYIPTWNREHSKLVKHDGYGYGDPNKCHVLYCGIGTSEKTFRGRLAEFSALHGNPTVWGVYNSTEGFAMDIMEVACQKLGIPTNAQRVAEYATRTIVDQMGEYKYTGTLVVEAHSQGAETVHNLSAGLRHMMEVKAIAPARILHRSNFREADNYINRLDIVPLVDPIGLIKGLRQDNVHYLPTSGNILSDHLYSSNNFKQIRSSEGYDYKRKYGWVE